MHTKDLCLATLRLGEASGYDIKSLFERAFRHFQKTSFGSIYPALNELSKAGLVSCQTIDQSGRPGKKTYSLTPAGEQEFLRVINETAPNESFQSDFLVLVLFSRWIRPQRLEAIFEEYCTALRTEINELTELIDNDKGQLSKEAKFTIEYGRHTIGASLEFLNTHSDALISEHRTTHAHQPDTDT